MAGATVGRATLPLRFLAQQAHFTTPASNAETAAKAAELGTAPMTRILQRFRVTPAALADRLGLKVETVEGLLERPRATPLVMLDAEDAVALRDDVTASAPVVAAEVLAGLPASIASLRFFRPPGFALGTAGRDLYRFLWALRARAVGPLPLDGIVFPKVDRPQEVGLL